MSASSSAATSQAQSQTQSQTSRASSRLEDILAEPPSPRIETLDSEEEEYEDVMEDPIPAQSQSPSLESQFSGLKLFDIPIHDTLETETSIVQEETLDTILPYLEGNPNKFDLNSHGIPHLQRKKHVKFLEIALGEYPAQFAAMDASRPWLLYWSLQGLTALGEDVSAYRERIVYTFQSCQHPTGGFGGGHGQLPHLAGSYASILSLVIVGTPLAYTSIHRRAMWHYLGHMKQPSGGFTMAANGEEDIRGAFCAMVILSLLNLPLELPSDAPARKKGMTGFLDGLGEWIGRCQSYEGGISAAPGNEAHGAYAFCGLACLCILGAPATTLPKYLDMDLLIHWLSSRQCAPEGGYNGRTNKLVDGCYSHWIGSCWSLVEAAVSGKKKEQMRSLWDRNALARYILSAAQSKKGGLIDKPGKRPDAYHTCYNLAGLSAVQNRYYYDAEEEEDGGVKISDEDGEKGEMTTTLDASFKWKVELGKGVGKERVWDDEDQVNVVHPVFIVPWGQAEKCRQYFEENPGF
ncbi:terpenoid cyclases/Protein prenyltransferase [Delitschia confertaspora ATCC 74209]|uniref:Protein farnesyltransferase subunit beta n=1 Tax=Delitschia confertaspora ATCC 74209 TaxID=1513339 RepID=A0A9P4MW97_9PLEO|nr:terpenoid cyclases/Protein prenyltransferase [Delitschia confertaspora ATCC 74209]